MKKQSFFRLLTSLLIGVILISCDSDDKYLITNTSVYGYKVGEEIPATSKNEFSKVRKETRIKGTEEAQLEEETVYILNEDSEDLLEFFPIYSENNRYEHSSFPNTGWISVVSKKFKTAKNIGIGSSIDDFIKAYPDYSITFCYYAIYCSHYIETKELPNVLFVLDEDNCVKEDEVITEFLPLKRSHFKKTARIRAIFIR